MIIITGATNGIGKACAQYFAQHGHNLILTGRNKERMEQTILELRTINNQITIDSYLFDVSDMHALTQFSNEIKEKYTVIDALINNAGLALGMNPIQTSELSDITTMINTNIISVFSLTQMLTPIFVEQNHGSIINIGSTAAIAAYANAAVYCSTKAAIKTFTDGIRLDLMPYNIKVTLVQPGMVETDFSLTRFKGDESKAKQVYANIDSLTPEDIARTVYFAFSQPEHVQIAELTVMATQQGNGFTFHRKK